MTVIVRSDGKQFIAQAYRELLQPQTPEKAQQAVKKLAGQQGKYLCFSASRNKTSKTIEAAFSKEPGYLLGETIAKHFNRPLNFLYCEALPKEDDCLVVIIRNGTIFFDGKVAKDNLNSELIPLITGTQHFHVNLYGKVAISDQPEPGCFHFPKKHIASFTQHDEPLFPTLKAHTECQLIPLQAALKSPLLPQKNAKKTVFLASIIFLVAVLGLFFFMKKPAEVKTQSPIAAIPFKKYNTALSSPSPTEVIDNVVNKINFGFLPAGWSIASAFFTPTSTEITLQNTGGTLTQLNEWANKNNIVSKIEGSNVTLAIKDTYKNRQTPKYIYPIKEVTSFFIDNISQSISTDSVNISQSLDHQRFKEASISIKLESVSPQTLTLIANQIANLPISLLNGRISIKEGLINGNINLSIWGN